MSSTTEKLKEKIPSKEELKEKIPSAEELKQDVVEAGSGLVHSLRALAAGGVGGVCAVLTGHPFDLVKVHLQTAEKGKYNGAIDVVKKIMAQSGPKGLYAGVTAPLFGVTPMFAISFWVCCFRLLPNWMEYKGMRCYCNVVIGIRPRQNPR